MKKDKDRQVGIRVGMPVFFALELEDVYRHTGGAHRALAFPDFVGLLVGLGLEAYRKGIAAPEIRQEEAPEGIEDGEGREVLCPFRMNPENPLDPFRDFDGAGHRRRGLAFAD
jgi:hypothetical protein